MSDAVATRRDDDAPAAAAAADPPLGISRVVVGAASLLTGAERCCDGAGIAVALNVLVRLLLLLPSLMHVAADDAVTGGVGRLDAGRLTSIDTHCPAVVVSPACRTLPLPLVVVVVVVVVVVCLAAVLHRPLLPVTGRRADDDTGSWLLTDSFPRTPLAAASALDADVLFLELINFNLSSIDASRPAA